jgi:hypothetical protein
VDEDRPPFVPGGELGLQRRRQRGRRSGVIGIGDVDRFVGQEVRLDGHGEVPVERRDLVEDGGDRPLGERHEPAGLDPHRPPVG